MAGRLTPETGIWRIRDGDPIVAGAIGSYRSRMTTSSPDVRLGKDQYVLLTTFRGDGSPVATPVWAAGDRGALVVWTPTASWKVKRIRNNPDVTVASCTARGRALGLAVAGRAEILDAEGTAAVRRLIMRKYWFAGRLMVPMSRWFKGADATIGIRIDLGAGKTA